jgi:hypothetical protein
MRRLMLVASIAGFALYVVSDADAQRRRGNCRVVFRGETVGGLTNLSREDAEAHADALRASLRKHGAEGRVQVRPSWCR